MWSSPAVLLRLRSISLIAVVNVLSRVIGSLSVRRLRGLGLMAQSYVGKHAISRRDRTSYTEVCGVFGVNMLLRRSREYPRILMDGGDRRHLRAERRFTAGAMICFRIRSQAEIAYPDLTRREQNRSINKIAP